MKKSKQNAAEENEVVRRNAERKAKKMGFEALDPIADVGVGLLMAHPWGGVSPTNHPEWGSRGSGGLTHPHDPPSEHPCGGKVVPSRRTHKVGCPPRPTLWLPSQDESKWSRGWRSPCQLTQRVRSPHKDLSFVALWGGSQGTSPPP